MLILTRRQKEKINISDNIEITILTINNGQVKIGIDAPKSIAVHRNEIYERIQECKI